MPKHKKASQPTSKQQNSNPITYSTKHLGHESTKSKEQAS